MAKDDKVEKAEERKSVLCGEMLLMEREKKLKEEGTKKYRALKIVKGMHCMKLFPFIVYLEIRVCGNLINYYWVIRLLVEVLRKALLFRVGTFKCCE